MIFKARFYLFVVATWMFGTTAPVIAQSSAETAVSNSVYATRTIRSRQLIAEGDVGLKPGSTGISDLENVIGMEAVRTIYEGRPIFASDLAEPALVERNALVSVVFRNNLLHIRTEARALARARFGERIRVMNIDSRTIVTGRVVGPSSVEVGE